MKKIIYYRIIDKGLIGKYENGRHYLEKNGKWVEDSEMVIADRLIGYDHFEDDDSPYVIGNTSIMDSIEEISEEKAIELLKKGKN